MDRKKETIVTHLCIMTGASKGLGKALSARYQAQGWQVYNLSRSDARDGSVHIACDFADVEATQKVLPECFQRLAAQSWTHIHLIHNAARVGAIGPLASQAESTPADWQKTLNVNFGAVVQVTGHFLAAFQAHSAQKLMACVSSGAAHKSYAGWSLYCATKAAMERFCLCVAEEQKHQNQPVASVIINPGVMDTEMQAHIRQADPALFPNLERFLTLKAEAALPSPENVAAKCFTYLQGEPVSGETFKVIF